MSRSISRAYRDLSSNSRSIGRRLNSA